MGEQFEPSVAVESQSEAVKAELRGYLDMFDLPAPASVHEAVERSEPLWVRPDPCPVSGHIGLRTLTSECRVCQIEVEAPTKLSPRQAALAAGEDTYVPEEPCKVCGERAPREVGNGRCGGCRDASEGNRTAKFMSDNPDLVLTKQQAKAMGLSIYRTGKKCRQGHSGYRYVSNSGCIDCKKDG